MPLLKDDYAPPAFMGNPDINTAWASKFRKAPDVPYERERFELTDGDFVDIDWLRGGHDSLVVILHGLGGNSSRPYVRGMAAAFAAAGWDAAAFNMRGQGGEMNRLPCTYHSGRTDDLREFVLAAKSNGGYRRVAAVGFSLGGNIVLKYAGEDGEDSPLTAAVAVSAPVDLVSSAEKLSLSRRYTDYLLKKLKPYIAKKAEMFPELVKVDGLDGIETFLEYDSRYTAPLNGFSSAKEYWTRCSALNFVPNLRTSALLINAKDDPILGPGCFPLSVARASEYLHFMMTEKGGHVGFVTKAKFGELWWHERKAVAFCERPPVPQYRS